MELRHLRYFLGVAREANFTRAAEKLGIGQPPLSLQIKQLEQELGVTLFERTPHGVVLTRAGEAFRIEAMRVLEDAQGAIRAAQRAGRGETGQLRLGFSGSSVFNPVVPALIRRFKQTWPDAELTLAEGNTPQLLQALTDERLDAAFVRPGAGDFAGLRLHRFPDEPMKIVLPTAHPLAKRQALSIEALRHEAFVMVPGPAGATLYGAIVEVCRLAGFEPLLAQPAPQIPSVINLVAAGLGISIVPDALSQVRVKGVRYLAIKPPAPVARLAFAVRAQDGSPTVGNMLALLGARAQQP
ncbi:LysR family transcriptional regulator [Trinickia caryophylli]|nr:LysR family transcriptional regulator [Trinickia caryophylli]PMS08711.1 transcriptional regulator [Trinickia caryophylli]TRX18285.1 LysR family transcriptional regulator [Trinickia caryophylli]WQE10929.1 LysR family transcriptional regulator [Trinickia caryophylli]GLU35871.1 LysR family transcriptional regulator [Trinickia caryophylli]